MSGVGKTAFKNFIFRVFIRLSRHDSNSHCSDMIDSASSGSGRLGWAQ